MAGLLSSPYTGSGVNGSVICSLLPRGLGQSGVLTQRDSLSRSGFERAKAQPMEEMEGDRCLERSSREAFYHLKLGWHLLHLTTKLTGPHVDLPPFEVRNLPAINLTYSPRATRPLHQEWGGGRSDLALPPEPWLGEA